MSPHVSFHGFTSAGSRHKYVCVWIIVITQTALWPESKLRLPTHPFCSQTGSWLISRCWDAHGRHIASAVKFNRNVIIVRAKQSKPQRTEIWKLAVKGVVKLQPFPIRPGFAINAKQGLGIWNKHSRS